MQEGNCGGKVHDGASPSGSLCRDGLLAWRGRVERTYLCFVFGEQDSENNPTDLFRKTIRGWFLMYDWPP